MCFDCSEYLPKRKRPRKTHKKCRKDNLTGKYRGHTIGHDVDMLYSVLYSVRYLDGDEEDLSLGELDFKFRKIPTDLISITSTIIT